MFDVYIYIFMLNRRVFPFYHSFFQSIRFWQHWIYQFLSILLLHIYILLVHAVVVVSFFIVFNTISIYWVLWLIVNSAWSWWCQCSFYVIPINKYRRFKANNHNFFFLFFFVCFALLTLSLDSLSLFIVLLCTYKMHNWKKETYVM